MILFPIESALLSAHAQSPVVPPHLAGSVRFTSCSSGETYDADGNVTATGGKTFTYDSQNELVSMNGGTVSLVYDGDGSRVAEMSSGVTRRYLVDNLNPTGYAQVVEETVSRA